MKQVVLVVDGEAAIRNLLKMMLEEAGYVVLRASSGWQALGLLSQDRVDAVLTDMIMPEMSGSELIERVREGWPRVAVCAMSSFMEVLPPSTPFIQKPFAPTKLLDTIEHALNANRPPAIS